MVYGRLDLGENALPLPGWKERLTIKIPVEAKRRWSSDFDWP
jgi:hypothetical protein